MADSEKSYEPLTRQELIDYFLSPFPKNEPGFDETATKLWTEGELKLREDKFWEGHNLIRDACLYAFLSASLNIGKNENSEKAAMAYAAIQQRYLELEVKRCLAPKEQEVIFPRETNMEARMSQEAAEAKADAILADGSSAQLNRVPVNIAVCIQRGEWGKAQAMAGMFHIVLLTILNRELRQGQGSSPAMDALFNCIFVNACCNAFAGFESCDRIRRSILKCIIESEGDPSLESDPAVHSVLWKKGFLKYADKPWMMAAYVKSQVLRFVNAGDKDKALKACRRFYSIQKGVLAAGEDYISWPDLEKHIKITESMLYAIQFGSIEDAKQDVDTLKVSVSLSSVPTGSEPLVRSVTPVFSIDDFKGQKVPNEEQLMAALEPKAAVPLVHKVAEGVAPMALECPNCTEYIHSVPTLVAGNCYMAGVAFSAMFIPVIIGLIPFSILVATKPCHQVRHFCPECNIEIEAPKTASHWWDGAQIPIKRFYKTMSDLENLTKEELEGFECWVSPVSFDDCRQFTVLASIGLSAGIEKLQEGDPQKALWMWQ